jgi:hypothetical protein
MGLVVTTFLLIVSLIVKQDSIVYKGIAISYVVCFVLLILAIAFCIIINKESKRELVLCGEKFKFLKREYLIEQVISCKYYVCKWYAIPIAFIYKQQAAGLIDIRFDTGERICFKILYKDYLKLKNSIQNIVEV